MLLCLSPRAPDRNLCNPKLKAPVLCRPISSLGRFCETKIPKRHFDTNARHQRSAPKRYMVQFRGNGSWFAWIGILAPGQSRAHCGMQKLSLAAEDMLCLKRVPKMSSIFCTVRETLQAYCTLVFRVLALKACFGKIRSEATEKF